jgi:hypothetical protein
MVGDVVQFEEKNLLRNLTGKRPHFEAKKEMGNQL